MSPAGGGAARGLRWAVFMLTAASYVQIYLTQPVLPVISRSFQVDAWTASLTVSLVIGGIAVGQVFWGWLADRQGIRPIILIGAVGLGACGLVASASTGMAGLALARLGQGLFIPAVSTCLAAFLAKSLPPDRVAVVLGAYVSATVTGGLLSRLFGGWGHWLLGWRWSFVIGAALVAGAAAWLLAHLRPADNGDAPAGPPAGQPGYWDLLARPELLRVYGAVMGAFFVFSSIFNYMPFRLAGPPFNAPTAVVTLIYLSFVLGIPTGPLAGRIENRLGMGPTVIIGLAVLAGAVLLSKVESGWWVGVALCMVCAGFFTVHAAATGALNQRLTASQGRANSLYVMFYYIAGYSGVTVSGWVFEAAGWEGVTNLGLAMLGIPLAIALWETGPAK